MLPGGTTSVAGYLGVTVNGDGTWSQISSADGATTQSFSGSWMTAVTGGYGQLYEIKYVWAPSTSVGSPAISNGAANWVDLSGSRSFTISATATSTKSVSVSGTLTITIRKVGTTTPTCTQSITLGMDLAAI